MNGERFKFRSWDETLLIRERLTYLGDWVEDGQPIPLSSPCPWTLPPMPSCSICRSDHGPEVQHACE